MPVPTEFEDVERTAASLDISTDTLVSQVKTLEAALQASADIAAIKVVVQVQDQSGIVLETWSANLTKETA